MLDRYFEITRYCSYQIIFFKARKDERRIHRDGDLPAFIQGELAGAGIYYFKNNIQHREHGPAVIRCGSVINIKYGVSYP